mgnify:CR=1 FL=1
MVETRRHTEVIRGLLEPAGRDVVDVGCGGGELARWFARQGARVVGVDAQPAALRRARAAGIPVAAARAEALPLATAGTDVVVVFNSLHHFAEPAAALAEARRVLRPAGQLYVVEPLAAGAYFTFMQPVDDETAVRARALDALAEAGRHGLAVDACVDYAHEVVVRDLDSTIANWLAVDPDRAPRIAAVRDELARRLDAHAVGTAAGYRLQQPMRAWLLRPA